MRTFLNTLFFLSAAIAPVGAQPLITSIAGTGSPGFSGDGGPATAATMYFPGDVTVDSTGNIYFPDTTNYRIRKITPAGIISTVAGTGVRGILGDGGPALAATLGPVRQVAVEGQRLCFGDQDARKIRCVNLATGVITGIGTGVAVTAGDGGPAVDASFYWPWGTTFVPRPANSPGPADLYMSDGSNNVVRKIDAVTGIITTIAGGVWNTALGDGGPATAAGLSSPASIRSYNGSLYIADSSNYRVRRVDLSTGIITTVAGNGVPFYNGDGVPATSAQLMSPGSVDFDGNGNMYILDRGNARVRMVDTAGIISTVAGNGLNGSGQDNVPGPQSALNGLSGLAWNPQDNALLIMESVHRLRRLGLVKTATAVATSPNPSTLGGAVTFSATVTPATANGTVQFFAQSTSTQVTQNIGTATVAAGLASVVSADLVSGPQNVWAVYSGSSSHAPSTSANLSHQVRFTSFTVLTSVTPSPAVAGNAVTLTANVYPPAGQTGMVQFFDGASAIGTVTLGANGVAQLVTSSLAAGPHTLTAAYSGSVDWANSSSSPVALTVNKTASTTTLNSAPSPSTYGGAVTLTATVNPATATGSVQFYNNGTLLGTANVASGVATLNTATLPAGANSLTATYSGSAVLDPSTSAVRAQTVNKANSTTTLALSATQVTTGQPVTFTATVSPAALVTGTVQFRNGSTVLGTVAVNNGTAVFTTSTLAAGNYSIRAVYGGSTNVNSSQSGTLSLRVRRP